MGRVGLLGGVLGLWASGVGGMPEEGGSTPVGVEGLFGEAVVFLPELGSGFACMGEVGSLVELELQV